jgi:chitin synthase
MSFMNDSRMSVYSTQSAAPRNPPSQVSTTSLLNFLNSSFKHSQAYNLEASTSLTVNTWVNAKTIVNDRIGGVTDIELGRKAWEHARRRAEDGCVILASLHESTPSLFAPFISSLPLSLPSNFYTALEVLKAFTNCVTPQNPFAPRYSALAAVFTINLTGTLVGAEIKLSTSGLDVQKGLLQVPAHTGFRAFDVFYYLNSSSATKQEREFLNIQPLDRYALLSRSGTYDPPSFLPDADDAAAAEDFRANLKAIGIKGHKLTDLLSCLAGLLKLGNTIDYFMDGDSLQATCEEVGEMLDISPEVLQQKLASNEREVAIGGIYEAIVDYVISQANETIRSDIQASKNAFSSDSDGSRHGAMTPDDSEDEAGDIVNITVVDVPSRALGKALALRTVFDDSEGINAEMKEDGVQFATAGNSVLEGMKEAIQNCEADLGISGPGLQERERELEKRETTLEKILYEIPDENNFVKQALAPMQGAGIVLGKHGRFDLPMTAASSRVWLQLAIHPTDSVPTSTSLDPQSMWQAGVVSRQLREWRLPEWSNRRNRSLDFTADFDHNEFYQRYHPLGCMEGRDGIQSWILQRGWSNGEVVVGTERVWVREGTWWEAESQLDQKTQDFASPPNMMGGMIGAGGLENGYPIQVTPAANNFLPPLAQPVQNPFQSSVSLAAPGAADAKSIAPTMATVPAQAVGDYGLGGKGDENKGITYYDMESGGNAVITETALTFSRRVWIAFVWAVTFWMPSPLLKWVGRMKRPDVRMAWREKVVLFLLIMLLNATIVFYIVAFGKLLCPNKDKVWSRAEVATHSGSNDYYVSHHGVVYDLSSFWKKQHSDGNTLTSRENMQPLGGADMDRLIVPPLWLACSNIIDPTDRNKVLYLQSNDTDMANQIAVHTSGPQTNMPDSNALKNERWYPDVFVKKIAEYRKGDLVWDTKTIRDEGENLNHMWFTLGDKVYDLTDYFKTINYYQNDKQYNFMDATLIDLVRNKAGTDLTEDFNNKLQKKVLDDNMQCLNLVFYIGKTDFRKTPKCMVNDYILLAVTIILCAVIVIKFLAALQLGSRRRPANQDKFVICQVPAYTEGEDQIRKGLDSLTALAYDNKRKLICVICDGMIVGGGNDRPTPKIVLDILGVDPKVDPPALPFWSVGEGSQQLNYGKVYSGLYEFEGNVVPYIVVVKMGKESEQSKSKPGNRGKRDSQILLMSFLNRVHFRSAMNPLELEMFHQINNIIGVDPELYEYLLMVDADTMVRPDALNRLVASCANDSKIAGICGETSLENEDKSWWTMIQVYEYYISHHLSKAFESLFGSVTCLPGW